jgi:molybdate transport system regulatory protein
VVSENSALVSCVYVLAFYGNMECQFYIISVGNAMYGDFLKLRQCIIFSTRIWLNMARKEIRLRCWIDVDGAKFFGPGRLELLQEIERSGSIASAAKAMGMSYKKAWAMVEEMNARGSRPYVITQKGGTRGGGTQITETGKRVMKEYAELVMKLDAVVVKYSDVLKTI